MARSPNDEHPTVLVAVNDADLRHTLVDSLHEFGYLVLEASDADETFQIARTHSRAIHLTLMSKSLNKGVLASALKPYQPHMSVWFLSSSDDEQSQDEITPETALRKVRSFFEGAHGSP